jgi:sec-independent protein translocase protein TatA
MAMGIENPVHLLFIAAVALVVLGPKRLPEVARALGQGIREFRDAMSQQSGTHEQPRPPEQAPAAREPHAARRAPGRPESADPTDPATHGSTEPIP